MLPAYSGEVIFCLITAMLCLLTGSILLFYSARKSNLFLGLSYLALGFIFTIISLSANGLLYRFPHLYRVANIFFLLYMPLSWLYLRSSIRQKHITAWDLLHLLPLLLYIIDFTPFFLLSGAHKAAIIKEDVKDLNQLLRFRQGWLLPSNFHLPFRLIQMAFYWMLEVLLLASAAGAWIRKDAQWLRWQYIYLALQLPIFLPTLIVVLGGSQSYYLWTSIPPAAACLLSALTLLFFPRILYNINNYAFLSAGRKAKHVLDRACLQQLNREMERYMEEKKPFLDPDFAIKELADAMSVPLHKLSAYINQETGQHFSDYVNHWRIHYCLGLIRDKKIINLNLNGIATKCGFNNRNTFSTAFKKFTGKSPSSYLHANA